MITSGYSPQAGKSLVLIIGMSGSGRSTAAGVLEEMNWYVVDNPPPELIMRMVELSFEADSPVECLAIVTDTRSRTFAGSLGEIPSGLRNGGRQPCIILPDANNDVPIARYDSVRCIHPLQENGILSQSIVAERQTLLSIKSMPDLIVDTSDISMHDLRCELEHQLSDIVNKIQQITIESFGLRHDVPHDADMFPDVRFLPNPCRISELHAGCDINKAVVDYVPPQPGSQGFLDNVTNSIELVLLGYRHEGKGFITVAVGCIGGHHQSVAVSEALAKKLEGVSGIDVNVVHRDIDRNQWLSRGRRN